jgi:PAS domain S-box-containing protein
MMSEKPPYPGPLSSSAEKKHQDALLEEGLAETFPASDPVSVQIEHSSPAAPIPDFTNILAGAVLSMRSDALVAADKDGTIRFWNPGAERIFGFSSAEALGQSLDIIIPERLRQRHWEGYDHAMQSGRSRYGEDDVLAVPAMRKDGHRISIEFTVVLIRDEHGQLVGIAAILRDVTKRFEELRSLRHQLADRPS